MIGKRKLNNYLLMRSRKSYISLLIFVCLCIIVKKSYADSPYPLKTDLKYFPQNANVYINPKLKHRPLIKPSLQTHFSQQYLKHYFSVWDKHFSHKKYQHFKHHESVLLLDLYRHPGWGVHHHRNTSYWISRLMQSVHLKHFPNMNMHAITIHQTSFRALPTLRPVFGNWRRPGQGYPFDRLQDLALPANVPILALQRTQDSKWVYIKTARGLGWVKRKDIAFVDKAFIKKWQAQHFVVAVADNKPLLSAELKQLQTTRIGTLYPYIAEKADNYQVYVAVANAKGYAKMQTSHLDKSLAKRFPYPLTRANMALVINQMLGDPYGWGGYNGLRDCSSTMLDLFTTFGLWLPRNSVRQQYSGHIVHLRSFSTQAKKDYILKHATPFLTLIHKPGHIMLYLGRYHGHAIVFQDTWGLPNHDWLGHEARAVIAKTIISPLNLGANHWNILHSYLDSTDAITYITHRTI